MCISCHLLCVCFQLLCNSLCFFPCLSLFYFVLMSDLASTPVFKMCVLVIYLPGKSTTTGVRSQPYRTPGESVSHHKLQTYSLEVYYVPSDMKILLDLQIASCNLEIHRLMTNLQMCVQSVDHETPTGQSELAVAQRDQQVVHRLKLREMYIQLL